MISNNIFANIVKDELYKYARAPFVHLFAYVTDLWQKASQSTGDICIFFKLIHMQIFWWIFARWRG